MPSFAASVPGKIILFGEHAVVYGFPAIAVPVNQVRAKVVVSPVIGADKNIVAIIAPAVGINGTLDSLPPNSPLTDVIQRVMVKLQVRTLPSCRIEINSTIPVAAGLGSGASVSVGLIRSLSGFLGKPLPDDEVSSIAFEVEKLHHGTPSGIDNTVVVYNKPVFFIKNHPIEHVDPAEPFTIVIGDTGIKCPTKNTVGEVRDRWKENPKEYERIFSAIGSITRAARQSIEKGFPERLGPLMDENHELLKELGVSSPELDHLANKAKDAGAVGVKLSGGGRGGNIVALSNPSQVGELANAIEEAGAVRTIISSVEKMV